MGGKHFQKFIDKDDLTRLLKLYPITSNNELCKLFPELSRANIQHIANSHNVKKKGRKRSKHHKWKTKELTLLKELYPKSNTKNILKYFPWCTDVYQLHLIARRYNISKKNLSLKELLNRDCGLHKLLEETSEAAYWIGFILADGHLSEKRLSITLARKDKDHLIKFQKFIGVGNILDGMCNGKNLNSTFTLQEPIIVSKLRKKFNIHNNKTINPPSKLPYSKPNLLLACLAGFIDGDGHIGYQSGRSHTYITVKNHLSWESWLQRLTKKILILYKKKFNWTNFGICRRQSKSKLSNIKYVTWSLFDQKTQIDLVNELTEMNLPLLNRKWNRINTNYKPKYDFDRCDKVRSMLEEGHRARDVEKVTGVSASQISRIKRNSRRR